MMRLPLLGFLACLPALGYAFDSVHLRSTLSAPPTIPKFNPQDLAVDPSGRLWVVEGSQQQVLLFPPAGLTPTVVGRHGKGAGEVEAPAGIGLDSEGFAYVADSASGRILVFSAEGRFQLSFGERGSEAGQLKSPTRVAVSQDGVVFVLDKGGSRVQLFSKDGVFYRALELGYDAEGLSVDLSGRFYTLNSKTKQVDVWSSAGQLLKSFSGIEPGFKAFSNPRASTVDSSGQIWVGDHDTRQLRVLTPAGKTAGVFGQKGSSPGQFKTIDAVAVLNDDVYVADASNHRITVLSLQQSQRLAPLAPAPALRLSVRRGASVPALADRLAWNADGSLMALSGNHLVTFDLVAGESTTLALSALGIKKPGALATAPSSGNLFLSDLSDGRVIKIDKLGKLLLEYPKTPKPISLACSPQGMLFVGSGANSQFHAYNHQGLFQFSAGERGSQSAQLKTPASVAWDVERIYVADPDTKKVAAFSSAGRFVREFGSWGPEPLEEPRAVTVDREGHVFVLDAARGRIQVYDSQGVYLGGFGSPGKTDGALEKPRHFALNDHGDLFVADQTELQAFHVVVSPPAPTGLAAASGEGYVNLKWDPVKTRYPARYAVYRRALAGDNIKIKETVETSCVDDTLTPNTTYAYTVAAISAQEAASVPSSPAWGLAKELSSGPRLEIVSAVLEDVFSAHYKYYGRSPLGRVTIKNNSLPPVQKIKLSFAIQGFMDYPTEVEITELRSMQEKEVPLLATFNNRILEVTETTPIQAQVKLTFYAGDQDVSTVRNLPFKLYSRNTIRWDNKERFAAFVTPNDPPVVDFTRSLAVPLMEARRASPIPQELVTAWSVFSGLGAYGISYLPRPNNPYDRVSLDSSTVDTLQFARETLARKSGDCADVVALLASMLESLTVTTVALDAPGHLFLMFDTGQSRRDLLGFPESMLVPYAGTYWIPIEATMVGQPFMASWKAAAELARRLLAQNKLSMIDIHKAWGTFEPATLPTLASGAKAPAKEEVEAAFLADWKAITDLRWQTATAERKDNPLQMGLLAVEFRRYDEAKEYFIKAKQNPALQAAAYNNLGNLAMIRSDIASAESNYTQAHQKDPSDPEILLNLVRVHLKAGRTKKAQDAYDKAIALDSKLREQYPDVSSLTP